MLPQESRFGGCFHSNVESGREPRYSDQVKDGRGQKKRLRSSQASSGRREEVGLHRKSKREAKRCRKKKQGRGRKAKLCAAGGGVERKVDYVE